MNKGKPENSFNIAKNQEFETITSCHFKNLIFPQSTWNLISSRNLKRLHPLPILCSYFRFFLKRFLRRYSKPGHGNLVLTTSTVQAELSKLNFSFDDIRTYFLQVLWACWQIAFVMLKRFWHPLFLTDNIKRDRICTYQNFLHCASSFEWTSYKNL